jgi:hypothetical protein
LKLGGVTEWLMVAVLKTVVPKGTRGSNPLSSVFFLPMAGKKVKFLSEAQINFTKLH